MKLQIRYNLADLDEALTIAQQTEEFADIIEVGSLLILQNGINAVHRFKENFPHKALAIDSRISSRGEDSAKLLCESGVNTFSALAGTYHSIIQDATKVARSYNIKVILDFINSHSLGQSAIEAKTLGADAVLFHRSFLPEENKEFFSQWQEVKANTNLPIFIKGRISKKILQELLPLKPHGFIIGSSITFSSNPRQEAREFHNLIKNF